ncbi:TRAP transporter TatT component family protein [Sphaerotilus mobilis]|uniref:TRAP transporter TatT component family protein n=1 Tax=Sphaerotilus mobilis TaxID=47994 RepID=A0A4Q7LL22_9BURK|nr:TRAP transporter TatT component family protein [Sphaerotilus mobilis]RZS54547.1 TRAP transporter TatT component family protein [Sphaerotilus mobilis]
MSFLDRSAAGPRRALPLLLLCLVTLLAACSPRHLVVRSLADELATQGAASEDDPQLAREAAAFYLKLSESVLRQTPEHAALAEAVAGGYTQYAYAFVASEAERLDEQDARAAQALRERAARLYLRARRHALATLERRQPGLIATLAAPASGAATLRLDPSLAGLAYWAAAAWGGQISLSKDHPDIVADLPQAIRLANLAWQAAPDHGDGALAVLMAQFESARPGGSRQQTEAYLAHALRVSRHHPAGAWLARAELIAQPAGDRDGYVADLQRALDAARQADAEARRAAPDAIPGGADLANRVLEARARWLLGRVDDLF